MEHPKLKVMALSFAVGILWALSVLFVGLINISNPEYGADFLAVVSSVYPGYEAEPVIGSVLIGTGYAFIDGAIGGALFAILYNLCLCCPMCKK